MLISLIVVQASSLHVQAGCPHHNEIRGGEIPPQSTTAVGSKVLQ